MLNRKNFTYSLLNVFLNSVDKYPENIALFVDNQQYTYTQLYNRALEIASALAQTKTKKTCAIYMRRQFDTYAAILASLLCNKPFMPLSMHVPTLRNAELLHNADCDVLLVDSTSCKLIPELINHQQIDILKVSDVGGSKVVPKEVVALDDNCYLLFTSGTTGKSKGIMITHRQILIYIQAMQSRLKPNCSNRFSQITDLTFDITVHEMFVCWSAGATLYVIQENYFIKLADFIERNALTHLAMVPAVVVILNANRQLKPKQFPSVKSTLFGGEILTYEVARIWQQAAPNTIIENHYGPTEGTIALFAHVIEDIDLHDLQIKGVVPIGRPFSGQQFKIEAAVKENMRLEGELYVAGAQIATGYWRQSKANQGRFIKESNIVWYATGDRVRLDKNNCLHFLGRKDHQIQIRGQRVEKAEIELVFKKICCAQSVVVLPWPVDAENVLSMLAFIVGNKQANNIVLKAASKYLPSTLLPSVLIFIKSMPLTNHHKIDYSKLKLLAKQYMRGEKNSD